MTAKKRRTKNGDDALLRDALDFEARQAAAHEQRLQSIREIQGAETFRVFSESSDPHHIGEFIVQIDREGITIRESYEETPSRGDDRLDDHQLEWYLVHQLAGGAVDRLREIQRDKEDIISELEAWEDIRSKEAHRILRAREIQRTAHVRQLCDRAADVLGVWERPRVAPKSASTWRELTGRRNGRPRS